MIKKLFALGIAAILVGLAYFVWNRQFSPEAKVMERVRNQLTDPDSAKFRGLSVNKTGGITCGSVNAKNKMGGYIGFKDFLVSADGVVTFDPDVPSATQSASEIVAASFKKIEFLADFRTHCLGSQTPSQAVDK